VEPKTLIAAIHAATDELDILYDNVCNDDDLDDEDWVANEEQESDSESDSDDDSDFFVKEALRVKIVKITENAEFVCFDEDEEECEKLKKKKIDHGEQGFVSYNDFETFNNKKNGPTYGDYINLRLHYEDLNNDERIEKVQTTVVSIAEVLDYAHDESFYLANFYDPLPHEEGFFMRKILLSEIDILEQKNADYLKILTAHDREALPKNAQNFISHWGKVRHLYLPTLKLLNARETSPPSFLRSLSHTLWFSKRYGLRIFFPNADSLNIYKDSNEQFGRPILSAYQQRKDEPIRPCELHTVLRVASVFNDRGLYIFDELTKSGESGVNFVGYRRACRKAGFEIKDHMFKKRKYFKNVNGDAFQKQLRLLHGGAAYLPEPYSHAMYAMSTVLELLIAVYRSVDPLAEFGYDNIDRLYRELVVSPIILLHRLLVNVYPAIIRSVGKSTTNTHCIDWCTRKFNDLLSEHAEQFRLEVCELILYRCICYYFAYYFIIYYLFLFVDCYK